MFSLDARSRHTPGCKLYSINGRRCTLMTLRYAVVCLPTLLAVSLRARTHAHKCNHLKNEDDFLENAISPQVKCFNDETLCLEKLTLLLLHCMQVYVGKISKPIGRRNSHRHLEEVQTQSLTMISGNLTLMINASTTATRKATIANTSTRPSRTLPFAKADSRRPSESDLELWSTTVEENPHLRHYASPSATKIETVGSNERVIFYFVSEVTATELYGPRIPTANDLSLWKLATSQLASLKQFAGQVPTQVSVKVLTNLNQFNFTLPSGVSVTANFQRRKRLSSLEDLLLWTQCAQYSRFRAQVPRYVEPNTLGGTLFFFDNSAAVLARKLNVITKVRADPTTTTRILNTTIQPPPTLPFAKADSRRPSESDLELWSTTVEENPHLRHYASPSATKIETVGSNERVIFYFVSEVTATELYGPRIPTANDLSLWKLATSQLASLKQFAGQVPTQVSVKVLTNLNQFNFTLPSGVSVTANFQRRKRLSSLEDLLLWTQCAQYSRFRAQVPRYVEPNTLGGALFFFDNSAAVLARKVSMPFRNRTRWDCSKSGDFMSIDTAAQRGLVHPMRLAVNMEYLDRQSCNRNGP